LLFFYSYFGKALSTLCLSGSVSELYTSISKVKILSVKIKNNANNEAAQK